MSIAAYLHQLQLCVRTTLSCDEEIKNLLGKCKKISAHFNHSQIAQTELHKIQKEQLNQEAWRNHGHSCFLCEIVIRSQFHTTYEPEA